ncbi:hypothetical protein [Schaalia sp. Marseille-Q2122]|uniref:hypothetical protein n=1 Tax=Schaalia sp. Marseille-Q2122 TaxID=2736604 RepID=UPI00158A12A3|nr:hypothetical protein [Schaalia sp. Marseille-Q2122]
MSAESLMPLPINSSTGAEHFTESIERLASRLSGTQVASASSHAVPNWIGEAADAYTDEIVKLRGCVDRLINVIPPVKKAVTAWGESVHRAATITVPQLHDEYDTATSSYHSQKDELRAMREEIDSGIYYAELSAIEEHYNSRVSDIVSRYKRAMNELDTEAHDTAVKIRAAIDAYISPEVVKKGRDAIGASLFDGLPLVDGQAEWEYAQKEAIEAAALLGDGTATPEKVREFHEKYGDMCKSSFFTYALFQNIPPHKLVEFSVGIDTLRGNVVKDGKVDPDFDRMLDRVIENMGTLFVLSTGGMNLADGGYSQRSFELVKVGLTGDDGATIEQMTQRNIADWKAVGVTTYDENGNLVNDENLKGSNYVHYGYEYIGAMLNHAALKNENLALGVNFFDGRNSLAQSLLRWDRDTLLSVNGENSGYGNWFPKPYGGDFRMLDPVQGMLRLMDQPAALSNGVIDFKGDEALRELVNDRYDAVQQFLAGDTAFSVDQKNALERVPPLFEGHFGPNEPMNVTRYLTSFRGTDSYRAMPDGGDALGRVLAQSAAIAKIPDGVEPGSEEYVRWLERQRRSTQIAASFLQGYQDGLDIKWSAYGGENAFGIANRSLRSWSGEILAPHIDDIAEMLNAPDGDTPGLIVDTLPDKEGDWDIKGSPSFKKRLLSSSGLFIDLAFDRADVNDAETPEDPSDDFYQRGRMPAVDRLLLATQQGYRAEIGELLSRGEISSMGRASRDWGALVKPLTVAPEGATEKQMDAINDNNRRLRSFFDGALSLVPLDKIVPPQAKPFVGVAFNYVKAPTLDALLPTDLSNEEGIDAAEGRAKTSAQRLFVAALSDDPQLMEKNPELKASMIDRLKTIQQPIPLWLTEDSYPMPSVEQMTEGERRVFREAIGDYSKFQDLYDQVPGLFLMQAE